jgi:hypothetical protein
MDDEENKPGVTQIPLIHDLAFDSAQPLKPPGKASKPFQKLTRKSGPYSPGYDPDTVDLFEDIIDPVEPEDEDVLDISYPDLTQEAANQKGELEEDLRAELSDELGSILEHLKDPPEA